MSCTICCTSCVFFGLDVEVGDFFDCVAGEEAWAVEVCTAGVAWRLRGAILDVAEGMGFYFGGVECWSWVVANWIDDRREFSRNA